mmetsp:Transcript_20015/g.41936  ORF Transcript_20015/g.41936 Transcript_20015/m.41936 type:complete len:443 (+) Transcript_20015:1039-2367(+)
MEPVVGMMRRAARMVDGRCGSGRRARRVMMVMMMRGADGRRGVHRADGGGRSTVPSAMVMRRRRRVIPRMVMRRRRRTVPSPPRVRRVPVRRRRRIVTVIVIVVRILLRRVIRLPLSGMMAVSRGGRRRRWARSTAVRIVGMLAGRRIPRGIVVVVIVLRGQRRRMRPSSRQRRSGRRRRSRPGVAALTRRQRRRRREFHRRAAPDGSLLLARELDVSAGGETFALLAHLAEDALGTRIVVVVVVVFVAIEALAAVAIVPVGNLLLGAADAADVRLDGIGKAKGGQHPVLSEAAHAGHSAAHAPSREGLSRRLPRGHGAQFEGLGAVMGVVGVRGGGIGGGRFGHDASVQRDVGGVARSGGGGGRVVAVAVVVERRRSVGDVAELPALGIVVALLCVGVSVLVGFFARLLDVDRMLWFHVRCGRMTLPKKRSRPSPRRTLLL